MVIPLAFGWRHLLFANWSVDAGVLDAHLPDALSIETYDGAGWLTVIPFLNVDVRPRGLPRRAGVDVPELNLRTYVTRDGIPGIYFFSLDAGSALAVLGARALHHLPYYYARMRIRSRADGVAFESRRFHPGDRPVRYSASYRPTGEAFAAESGSLAEFLTERRRLYTQGPSGAVRYTDVKHDRWTLYPSRATTEENTLFEANAFDRPEGGPTLYYSPGVDVVTTGSKRWDRAPRTDQRGWG